MPSINNSYTERNLDKANSYRRWSFIRESELKAFMIGKNKLDVDFTIIRMTLEMLGSNEYYVNRQKNKVT